MKRRKYTGHPFPKTAYARIQNQTGEMDADSAPFAEFWSEDGPGGMLTMNEPAWVATYRLVSVRKLKRTVKVVRAR